MYLGRLERSSFETYLFIQHTVLEKMPQHKSAAKRVRQNEVQRSRNRVQRSTMRTKIKNVQSSTDKEEAVALLNDVKSTLDRLVGKNIIKRNQAANYKSSLEKSVNALS